MNFTDEPLRFRVHKNWAFRDTFELFVVKERESSSFRFSKGQFKDRSEHGFITEDELLQFTAQQARDLYDALGSAMGLPQQNYLDGMVKAQEANLQDLRLIISRIQL